MNETNLATRLAAHLNFRYPELVAAVAALFAPIITFFSVPVLLGLMTMLVLDFLTGIVKAQHLARVSSARFGVVFERSVLYVLMYLVLHMLTIATPVPWDFFTKLFEGFVMTGLLFKESLSVLENLKGTMAARGRSVPILDLAITKLGIDLDHIMKDFAKLQPPGASAAVPPPAVPLDVAQPPAAPVNLPEVERAAGSARRRHGQLPVPGSPPVYQVIDPNAPPAGPDAPQAG